MVWAGECLLDTLLPLWGHASLGYCVALLHVSPGALLGGFLTGKTCGATAATSVPPLLCLPCRPVQADKLCLFFAYSPYRPVGCELLEGRSFFFSKIYLFT